MKTLIWIDFVLQTVLLCLASVILVASAVAGKDYLMFLFIIQFLIGVLQVFTALVHLIVCSPQEKLRIIHLAGSGLCLFTFSVTESVSGGDVIMIVIFGAAWALAILYYVITWRLLFPPRTSRSKFLPHLSF